MGFFQKNIRNQLLAGFVFLSVASSSVIGVLAYNSGQQNIVLNVQNHLESVAIKKKQAIEKWVEHLQHSLTWLANGSEVAIESSAIVIDPSFKRVDKKEYHSLVSRFKKLVDLGHVSEVFLLDKDNGKILVSSNPTWEGRIKKDELFFENGKKGFYISDIFLSLSLGRPAMVISGPVRDSNGNLIGILAAHADFTKLSEIMLERTGLSKTTETFLVNKSNLLITNTVFAPDGAFKKWIFGDGARWAISGRSGVDIFTDYRNVKVLGAYLWLEDRKLALISKQDASEAFKSISLLRRRILAVAIVVSILAIIAGMLIANRITKPLMQLVEGAREIGAGNLNYRIKTFTKDEIGVLSKAFDDMVQNLKVVSISRDEKEVLLREIHHRVKNNMQVIVSLLSLQAEKVNVKKFSEMFKESQNRIKAMSLVHEKLYQSEDLANIDFGEYVKSFVDSLAVSHGIATGKIDIETYIENISFDLENAIPCGLIINELVTNAIKHAFPNDQKGKIVIAIHEVNEEEFEIVVKDDGIGLPEGFDIDNTETLGLDLTKTVAEHQLDGQISIEQENGTAFHVIIKRQKYKARV